MEWKNNREMLLAIAKGNVVFDLLLEHGRLVNVYTEEIMEEVSVGVLAGRIAAINSASSQAKEKVDLHGAFLVPGLLDAHMHIETSNLNPHAWEQLVLCHGTTTAFCDPMELANVYGSEGIELFGELTKPLKMHIFTQIPSRIPAIEGYETNGGKIGSQEVERLLKRPEVSSLGEVSAVSFLNGEKELFAKLSAANAAGKIINGHYPMPEWNGLNAFVAAGISDDHESVSYEELKQKLCLGLPVMVREGSIEPNVEALVKGIVKEGLPTDSLMFCTDDKSALDLLEKGHVDYAVRKAVELGMSPIQAVKMATLNTARHYHMEQEIGSITPGRRADFLVVTDLEHLVIKDVYVDGKKVDTEERKEINYPDRVFHTIHLPENFSADSLKIRTENEHPTVRVIRIAKNELTTTEQRVRLKVGNGVLCPDIANDILPVAVIERYGKNGNVGNAFVQGLQIHEGAIASSHAQEANNLVVCGTNYEDMELAVRKVAEIDGGMVVVKNNQVLYANPMPIAGILYECEAQEALERMKALREAVQKTGCPIPEVFSYLSVLTAPSIPQLGLTDVGLIEAASQKKLKIIVDKEK